MNCFVRELLPVPRVYYEDALGKLTRPNHQGWARAFCPVHKGRSKSFSVNVMTGAFCCHGCAVGGGDVIGFVQWRYQCSFVEACKRLGAWTDVTPAEQARLDAENHRRQVEREREVQRKQAEHEQRIAQRDQIHELVDIERKAAERLGELERGAQPLYPDEAEHCWAVMGLAFEDRRLAEAEYLKICELDEESL